jgi:hypothetical protein
LWESNKKSIKTKAIILIVLSVSFVPISYLWYGALSRLDCKESEQNRVMIDLNDKHTACASKTSSHWMIFYGFNAMIYGMPLAALILKSKNRSI